MQPNRTRVFQSPERYYLNAGNPYSGDLPIKYMKIEDVNNKRKRPLSPCVSSRVVCEPRYAPLASWINAPGVEWALNIPPEPLLEHAKGQCADVTRSHESRAYKFIQAKTNEMAGEFSTLNFLYELREVGSLFKDLDGKWRKLSSYRPIDWIFGVAPLAKDVLAGLKHYNNVASTANEQLKRFKNFKINRRFMDEVHRTGEISFFSGNGHYQDDSYTIVTRVKGEISCDIPWLAQIDPAVWAVFDAAALDLSAANAWNAISFSWLFDWMFPFGDFLSSLPSFMRPRFYFKGTISTKIIGVHKTETRYNGPGFRHASGYAGSSFATTIYNRRVVDSPTTGMVKWDFAGGINSLSRSLVARDILQSRTKDNQNRGAYDRLIKGLK